jgi:hypothetical protein
VSPKQLQPWAQVNHILDFKITHQVDINFPVGWCGVVCGGVWGVLGGCVCLGELREVSPCA